MDVGPEESGVFTPGKVFEGKFCVQVSIEDMREGDYIEFYRQGFRVRRVKEVHRGRKHSFVQYEPSKYNEFKKQQVSLKDIKAVWRPQSKRRKKPKEMQDGPQRESE